MMSRDEGFFNVEAVRAHFPFLRSQARPIYYLDNAATSQKPQSVLEKLTACYEREYANVHRGVYSLSERATQAYEAVRSQLARFLGGVKCEEIVFTSGTTGAINLVARSWGESQLRAGDEIVLTIAEHHSNIVPWQMLAKKLGLVLKFIPLTADYRLDLEAAKRLIGPKTRLLAMGHVSNVLGVIHPVKELVAIAKSYGATTLVDGAQAMPHLKVDVLELGCDFYCFSSHKMLGPTGLGVLYGKEQWLEAMPPFFGGGEMIASVTTQGFSVNSLPYKFEAGTPPIAQVVGLGEAIRFLEGLDRAKVLEHDRRLGLKAITALKKEADIRLFTQGGDDWVGIVTFSHESIHPHDIAAIQDAAGVCVRAGHHCAQPLMRAFDVPATIRISPYLYNTDEDIEHFLAAMAKVKAVFKSPAWG